MRKLVRLLPLLLCLPPLLAEPALEVGVADRAGLLRVARSRVIGERLNRIAEQGEVAVAIVVERGDEQTEEAPQDAADWLRVWAKELTPEPATEPVEPREADVPEPLPSDLGRRAVIHVSLESQAVTLAGRDEFLKLIGPEQRTRWTDEWIAPALAGGDVEVLADALDQVVEDLGRAAGVAFDEHTPVVEEVAAPPAPPQVVVPRPWLNVWWFVLLPTLLVGGVLIYREGPVRGCLLLPPVFLLYAGLFLLLRFNPLWFMVIGVAAVAPVLLLMGAPPRAQAPGRARPLRQVGHGGFGVTGFGGLGVERVR